MARVLSYSSTKQRVQVMTMHFPLRLWYLTARPSIPKLHSGRSAVAGWRVWQKGIEIGELRLRKPFYKNLEDTLDDAGITKRQLGYWRKQGLFVPELGALAVLHFGGYRVSSSP